MATYSDRKVQKILELMVDLNDGQMEKLTTARNEQKRRNNDDCIFLRKLPAEIKSMIYEYVAADAHAEYHKSKDAVPCRPSASNGEGLGRIGKVTNVPGLLGTCREIFLDFHSIFYSPKYWNLRSYRPDLGWYQIKNPVLIDVAVNTKHLLTGQFYEEKRTTTERYMQNRKHSDRGTILVVYPSDPTRFAENINTGLVWIGRRPPWSTFKQSSMGIGIQTDCKTFKEEKYCQVPDNSKCSMCLISHRHTDMEKKHG